MGADRTISNTFWGGTRMLWEILICLGILVVVLLLLVAFRPKHYTVTRTQLMKASPESIFAEVNNFRRWEAWSPWAKIDPNMQQTYSGPESGEGAEYRWQGNSKVGQGGMKIREADAPSHVGIDLEFLKPFAATCDTQFSFKPQQDGTLVTWTMAGTNNYIAKLFGLIFNMDKMIGADFEKGLTALKGIVEKAA